MTDSVDNGQNPRQAEYLKHLYRGSELLLNDRIDEARVALEEASRIDPDDPKCLSLLGLVYFRLDDFEPAQQIYELLVQRFPKEASLRVNLGLVYMKQGDADRALSEMQQGVAIDPEHKRAFGYLGLLLSERGEHERAREAFERAGQEAMVEKMNEVLASGDVSAPVASSEISTDALPPDPEPFGRGPVALEPEASPVTLGESAVPEASMQSLTSDGQTLPVAAASTTTLESASAAGAVPPPHTSQEQDMVPEPEQQAAAPEPEEPVGMPEPEQQAAAPEPEEPVGMPEPEQQAADPEPELEAEPEAEPEPEPEPEEPVGTSEPEPEGSAPGADSPSGSASAAQLTAPDSLDDEIDAVIDQAVAPREPWPSESGILPQPFAEGFPSGAEGSGDSAERLGVGLDGEAGEVPREREIPAEVDVGQGEQEQRAGQGANGGEAVPIFSFATTGFVDLGARFGRMRPLPPSGLVFPLEEDGFIREESLTAYTGELTFEQANRRAKGQFVDEPMVDDRGRFVKVLGEGVLLCDAGAERLTVLELFDDFLYLRLKYLFAFESTLHWENGKVRGLGGPIELIHIRGEGRMALVGVDRLRKVRLVPDVTVHVADDDLVGWMGRIAPQTVPLGTEVQPGSPLRSMLCCVGEGVLLLRKSSGPSGLRGQLP